MNKPIAFGLNLKKPPNNVKPAAPKRKPVLGGDDSDSDGETNGKAGAIVESIGGDDLDDFAAQPEEDADSRRALKLKRNQPSEPPKLNSKRLPDARFGDLSSSLTANRNAKEATELDSSVYEYDAVYDSLKPKKAPTAEDAERRPKYMKGLLQAAETRKRDALIAEEKKIAREREAEGEEFADKEKFVTAAYKRQQEENRRLEEEEKKREEEQAKKNQGSGMSAFFRDMLNKDEQRHADAIKSAETRAQEANSQSAAAGADNNGNDDDNDEIRQEAQDAKKVKDLKDQGADIAVNEDGQVVDRRQLLKGGLNIDLKKTQTTSNTAKQPQTRDQKDKIGQQFNRKQETRERQSRMLAEQLQQAAKRTRDGEEEKRAEVERAAKSRKTDGEISSAKERYLARKKAAEEEKRKKEGGTA